MTVNRLLSGALVLLGFASCTSKNGDDDYPLEYGTPSVSYQVKGRVTDVNAKAIEGIRVIVKDKYEYLADTLYTDANGEYKGKESVSGSLVGLKAVFDDVDGEAHGGMFASDSIDVEKMEKVKVKDGSGHWYAGGYELTANGQLKLKKEDTPSEEL